jgi:hypothetical protein
MVEHLPSMDQALCWFPITLPTQKKTPQNHSLLPLLTIIFYHTFSLGIQFSLWWNTFSNYN